MVFAINPTADKSFEAFQAAAKGSSASGTPSTATGAGSGSTTSGTSPSSSSSSNSNGAVVAGARAGGLLAMVGLAAGILL
jgi:hypothetical protein